MGHLAHIQQGGNVPPPGKFPGGFVFFYLDFLVASFLGTVSRTGSISSWSTSVDADTRSFSKPSMEDLVTSTASSWRVSLFQLQVS